MHPGVFRLEQPIFYWHGQQQGAFEWHKIVDQFCRLLVQDWCERELVCLLHSLIFTYDGSIFWLFTMVGGNLMHKVCVTPNSSETGTDRSLKPLLKALCSWPVLCHSRYLLITTLLWCLIDLRGLAHLCAARIYPTQPVGYHWLQHARNHYICYQINLPPILCVHYHYESPKFSPFTAYHRFMSEQGHILIK